VRTFAMRPRLAISQVKRRHQIPAMWVHLPAPDHGVMDPAPGPVPEPDQHHEEGRQTMSERKGIPLP
jgi:hypothetical protein